MSDMEKTMRLEENPYDRLVEGYDERVKEQQEKIEEYIPRKEMAADLKPERMEPVEIIPLAEKARFSKLTTKELGSRHNVELEIEEDMLVPDTEPDMGMILNVSGHLSAITVQNEENRSFRGEVSLEILYHSADSYNEKIVLIKGRVPFKKEWSETIGENTELDISGHISKIEYRIINERKYRVKVHICVEVQETCECVRDMFDDIEGEELEFLKENAAVLSLAFTKNKETEMNEKLQIDNEKIRPVKILKSSFNIAENHRQLTSDKLVINETIWVRIMYIAELASKGNLSNQPLLYTGKIDNTQFIPLGGGQNIAACKAVSDVSNLTAEINDGADGFIINGLVKTNISFFEILEKEIVKDFYNKNDEMACDNKEENVCCGFETRKSEQTLRESISIKEDAQRIVFLDAGVQNIEVVEGGARAEIKGKLHIEAVTMTESNQPALAKKITDFSVMVDIPDERGYVSGSRIFVREMTGDIVGQNQINVVVHLQAEADFCKENSIRVISNPCIIRGETPVKHYPVILYTVKQNESLWDIAKKYRVPAAQITEINKVDSLREGMKIVVAK